jgi:hypothetical protein
MALRLPRHRALLLPFALGVVLAALLVGPAVGDGGADRAAVIAGVPPAAAPARFGPVAAARPDADLVAWRSTDTPASNIDATGTELRDRPTIGRGATVRPEISATARTSTTSTSPAPAMAVYRGRNHVWIPALGIDRSVSAFPCSRTRPPDNRIYRWGCSGRNNVYLLGHAYSVFKPLHDAYVRGRLRKGMQVFYADSSGRVRLYEVVWWRVTKPTAAAKWAWAPQPVPSMTLQTCVGKNSEYRLMVRLVEAG